MPCVQQKEITEYHEFLEGLIKKRTDNAATSMKVDQHLEWNNLFIIPVAIAERMNEIGLTISVQQWKTLTQLQRFALMKLSRPGHESKNFPGAIEEFGLMSQNQKTETNFVSR